MLKNTYRVVRRVYGAEKPRRDVIKIEFVSAAEARTYIKAQAQNNLLSPECIILRTNV